MHEFSFCPIYGSRLCIFGSLTWLLPLEIENALEICVVAPDCAPALTTLYWLVWMPVVLSSLNTEVGTTLRKYWNMPTLPDSATPGCFTPSRGFFMPAQHAQHGKARQCSIAQHHRAAQLSIAQHAQPLESHQSYKLGPPLHIHVLIFGIVQILS